MAFLTADKTTTVNGVKINEYLLTKHNPNRIAMPTISMVGKVIGVTIHNTDWITTASGTSPAEQYSRATVNGNMGEVRVHYYVDDVCAWQNLPHELSGWHAADGTGDGNTKTIAIECIMSSSYTERDQKSEDNAARLAAYLLKQYDFGIDRLYTHNHWYNKKYCPAYILPHWEKFKAKVQSYLEETASTISSTALMYRIRKTWDDIKSQVGAYTNLESAKKVCPENYTVFDNNGKAVYTNMPEKFCDVKIKQIQKGDNGSIVKSLQVILIAKNYSCGSYGADGDFGNATFEAVKKFQSDKKLTIDGVVGQATWNALFN